MKRRNNVETETENVCGDVNENIAYLIKLTAKEVAESLQKKEGASKFKILKGVKRESK